MRRLPAFLVVLSLAATPLAANAMPKPEVVMKAWDKDKDGTISPAEWTTAKRPAKQFKLVDTNNDGKITLEELRIGMAKKAKDDAAGRPPPQ
jgi:hypothetical protein